MGWDTAGHRLLLQSRRTHSLQPLCMLLLSLVHLLSVYHWTMTYSLSTKHINHSADRHRDVHATRAVSLPYFSCLYSDKLFLHKAEQITGPHRSKSLQLILSRFQSLKPQQLYSPLIALLTSEMPSNLAKSPFILLLFLLMLLLAQELPVIPVHVRA